MNPTQAAINKLLIPIPLQNWYKFNIWKPFRNVSLYAIWPLALMLTLSGDVTMGIFLKGIRLNASSTKGDEENKIVHL